MIFDRGYTVLVSFLLLALAVQHRVVYAEPPSAALALLSVIALLVATILDELVKLNSRDS